jgi:5-(carboxyamino)imidazole ribonucleotide mutase
MGTPIIGSGEILSILQMPSGVPVATVALNGSKNAGILAAKIIGIKERDIQKKILEYKADLKLKVSKDSIK